MCVCDFTVLKTPHFQEMAENSCFSKHMYKMLTYKLLIERKNSFPNVLIDGMNVELRGLDLALELGQTLNPTPSLLWKWRLSEVRELSVEFTCPTRRGYRCHMPVHRG